MDAIKMSSKYKVPDLNKNPFSRIICFNPKFQCIAGNSEAVYTLCSVCITVEQRQKASWVTHSLSEDIRDRNRENYYGVKGGYA